MAHFGCMEKVIKEKMNSSNSIRTTMIYGDLLYIYQKLMYNYKKIQSMEEEYHMRKDKLVNELDKIVDEGLYSYGEKLSKDVDESIEKMRSMYEEDKEKIDHIIRLLGNEIKVDKKYIFQNSSNECEMYTVTGLEMIQAYFMQSN
jgi:hypothetical protein